MTQAAEDRIRTAAFLLQERRRRRLSRNDVVRELHDSGAWEMSERTLVRIEDGGTCKVSLLLALLRVYGTAPAAAAEFFSDQLTRTTGASHG